MLIKIGLWVVLQAFQNMCGSSVLPPSGYSKPQAPLSSPNPSSNMSNQEIEHELLKLIDKKIIIDGCKKVEELLARLPSSVDNSEDNSSFSPKNTNNYALLVDDNRSLSEKNKKKYALLVKAITRKHKAIAEKLISNAYFKSGITFVDDETGKTILYLATKFKLKRVVQALLQQLTLEQVRQQVSLKDKDGRTPFHIAADCNNFDAFQLMFNKIVDGEPPNYNTVNLDPTKPGIDVRLTNCINKYLLVQDKNFSTVFASAYLGKIASYIFNSSSQVKSHDPFLQKCYPLTLEQTTKVGYFPMFNKIISLVKNGIDVYILTSILSEIDLKITKVTIMPYGDDRNEKLKNIIRIAKLPLLNTLNPNIAHSITSGSNSMPHATLELSKLLGIPLGIPPIL